MKYLLIENNSEMPLNGLVLGATTAKGDDSKIGQFGSGSLHAILTLMRHKVKFFIFTGDREIEFYVDEDILGNKVIELVKYRYEGKEFHTGTCLEFGAIDWTDIKMALREFISNAIDQDQEVCQLKLSDKVEGEKGKTRVYIEWNPEVKEYIENIDKYFLHFSYREKCKYIPVANGEKRGPRIYRRGVLVRELRQSDPAYPAKYDYNFQDMPIDECRNLNDYTAEKLIAECFDDEDYFVEMTTHLINKDAFWETKTLSPHDLPYKFHKEWLPLWKKHFGDLLLATSIEAYNYGIEKYARVVYFENHGKKYAANGVPTVDYKPLDLEKHGYQIEEESPSKDKFDEIWNFLEKLGLTNGKEKPAMKTFFGLNDTLSLCGEYRDGTVYLHTDYVDNTQVILEELCHHITESYDGSRMFQNFAFQVAARILDKYNE